MSPKPKGLATGPEADLIPSESRRTATVAATSMHHPGKEEKEEKRKFREFLRMENMFGLEQHQFNTLWLGLAHILAVYSIYLTVMGYAPRSSILFDAAYGYIAGLGITVGCHRLWTHKTFKANLPLQYLLMIMQTISNQYSIYKWSLDHRIHHKYTDTNADPHNSTRGFWFSHMGWLFVRKHPELKEKLKTFDMPDLEKDPVVLFQSRWYWTLTFLFHLALPISVYYYIWRMPLLYCVSANFRRYILSLHSTWTVNSVAHIWGEKPYDKSISPVENRIVAILAIGEGWHNYHHTFPWDYKASEWGWKLNMSTMSIDFFAWMGWVHDLKTVSRKMLKERLRRTGDGSHTDAKAIMDEDDNDNDFDYSLSSDVTELMKSSINEPLWGWDDEHIPDEFRKITRILRPET